MRSFRLSPAAYRRITLVALVALGFIILTGGAVRLTGSGLGCSDWPTCEHDQLVASFDYHPMVEFVNRTITGLVSVVVILAVLGSLVREPRRRDLTWLSWGLVAGVVGQIVLGGITVLLELRPQLVMSHFLLSMVLVWNAVVLHHRAGQPDVAFGGPTGPTGPTGSAGSAGGEAPSRRRQPAAPPAVMTLGRWLVASAAVVVFTGTIVTSTGPHGGDTRAVRFDLPITTVARIHSLAAWILVAGTLLALWLLHRAGAPARLLKPGHALLAVIVAQGAIGYIQYATGVPALIVGFHLAGAVCVWVAALWFFLNLWQSAPEVDISPTRDPALARA